MANCFMCMKDIEGIETHFEINDEKIANLCYGCALKINAEVEALEKRISKEIKMAKLTNDQWKMMNKIDGSSNILQINESSQKNNSMQYIERILERLSEKSDQMLKVKCPMYSRESMSYTTDYDATPCIHMKEDILKHLLGDNIYCECCNSPSSVPKPNLDDDIKKILERLSEKD